MALTLRVDGAQWRAHQDAVSAGVPGLVPVAKGNGYGFGIPLLAEQARRLGADTVAVGLPSEVAAVRTAYDGDVLVLEPHLPGSTDFLSAADDRLVWTVASAPACSRVKLEASLALGSTARKLTRGATSKSATGR